jgi:alpha-tubulin suppressor-like RCC1 family protein
VGRIVAPKRVSPDTNWVDVGFGESTVFAIKSDGSLWTWGREADRYTGASDPAQNSIPTQVGTNSDWMSLCATTGWWCSGLIKIDGSLWLMDGSDGKPNGPSRPYQPVQFRPIEIKKNYVAFAAGAAQSPVPGVLGPVGALLTRDGEVWTWGMVLGDPSFTKHRWQATVVKTVRRIYPKTSLQDPKPEAVSRDHPWRLRNVDAN